LSGKISDQRKKIDDLSSRITSVYQIEVADGSLNADAVGALAETLLRVPPEYQVDLAIDKRVHKTPEKLYLWGIANSNIVLPYLSLKTAVENMKHSLYAPRSWGVIGNKYRLPKAESTADSNIWDLIREVFLNKFGKDRVENDGDVNESVPDLSADVVAKQPIIESIITRLMELVRNPLSATLRSGEQHKTDTVARNAVDFVFLEHIFQRDEGYKNLTLSALAISSGRRTKKVETVGEGNRLTITNVFLGYKLAEILCRYLPKSSAKSPEGEPFVQAILSFIRACVPEDLHKYKLPKHFFETPSNQLRARVREGPKIKTKKGEKHNLYVPFSFVKAAECVSFPEITKRRIIDTGTKVLKNLDEVNKYSVTRANDVMPFMTDYLSFAYALSDKCRKEWRRAARVPDAQEINNLLDEEFPDLGNLNPEGAYEWSSRELKDELNKLENRALSLVFKPAVDDPVEISRILEEIKKVDDTKKTRRAERLR
jgi:hypothetical protein